MTKNYCDKCGAEIINNNMAKLSFMGNVNNKFLYSGHIFCEDCYEMLNTEINKYMGLQTTDKI